MVRALGRPARRLKVPDESAIQERLGHYARALPRRAERSVARRDQGAPYLDPVDRASLPLIAGSVVPSPGERLVDMFAEKPAGVVGLDEEGGR